MKANRKAFNNDEEAVSPVIAVILMVAITVVLAATVFVLVNELGQDIGETGPTLGFSTAGSATNTTQWTIRTTSTTDTAAFSEYTYALTAAATSYTNSSWATTGTGSSAVSGVLFEVDSDTCYRLALVTSGSELGVGERLQLRYQDGDSTACGAGGINHANWDDDPETIPTDAHELELIHRPTSTSSATISRSF